MDCPTKCCGMAVCRFTANSEMGLKRSLWLIW